MVTLIDARKFYGRPNVEVPEGWSLVTNAKGESGYVPAAYLAPLASDKHIGANQADEDGLFSLSVDKRTGAGQVGEDVGSTQMSELTISAVELASSAVELAPPHAEMATSEIKLSEMEISEMAISASCRGDEQPDVATRPAVAPTAVPAATAGRAL